MFLFPDNHDNLYRSPMNLQKPTKIIANLARMQRSK